MKSGIAAGAVAGLVGGLAAFTTSYAMLPPEVQVLIGMNYGSIKWFISQVGLNLVWGALYGWIFSKVYALIPSSGVMKGLTFSIMIWIFFIGLYPLSFFLLVYDPPLLQYAPGWGIVGLIARIFYGVVLGALYKK